jgi:hypothetical protein
MRGAAIVLVLAAVASPFGARGSVPQRDGAAILKDVRAALGGEAVLDGIQSLSMRAEGEMAVKGLRLRLADEYLLLLPDNYLRTRRLDIANLSQYGTPNASRVFEGFKGPHLIRGVSGGRALPNIAAPDGDRLMLAKLRHDAARLFFALTGRSMSAESMELNAAGIEDVAGVSYEILEARVAEGLLLRLHLDAKTHLPAMVTSTLPPGTTETRWLLSEFKRTGPVHWPRHIEDQTSGVLTETLSVREWKVNPKIDPRKFDVGRRDEP